VNILAQQNSLENTWQHNSFILPPFYQTIIQKVIDAMTEGAELFNTVFVFFHYGKPQYNNLIKSAEITLLWWNRKTFKFISSDSGEMIDVEVDIGLFITSKHAQIFHNFHKDQLNKISKQLYKTAPNYITPVRLTL